MNQDPTYYENLLNRYFAGEATEAEMADLHAWVKKDPENKKLFEKYVRAWDAANTLAAQKSINIGEAWKENLEQRSVMQPASKRTFIWQGTAFRVAAAVIILISLFFLLRMLFIGDDMQKMVANSGVVELVLPDQSKVSLAEGSVLEYPKQFDDKRIVNLTGKAYFVVEHQNEKSFIVACEGTHIKVLGTRFFVGHSEEQHEVEVVLDQGEVAIYFEDKPEQQMVLQPNERAEASLSKKKILKKPNTDQNYLSWKTRDFVFENTSLAEVFETLSGAYNISIIPENDLSTCKLTATFEDQSLTSVMRVIQATFDVRIIKSNGVMRVSGEPCN